MSSITVGPFLLQHGHLGVQHEQLVELDARAFVGQQRRDVQLAGEQVASGQRVVDVDPSTDDKAIGGVGDPTVWAFGSISGL